MRKQAADSRAQFAFDHDQLRLSDPHAIGPDVHRLVGELLEFYDRSGQQLLSAMFGQMRMPKFNSNGNLLVGVICTFKRAELELSRLSLRRQDTWLRTV